MDYLQHKVSLPAGTHGKWAIERFEVTQEDAERFNMRCRIDAHKGIGYRGIKAGTYTRLCNKSIFWNQGLVMSDTPAEISDHLEAIEKYGLLSIHRRSFRPVKEKEARSQLTLF